MIHASHMSSRNQFGSFLNNRGLLSLAVEIGTHRGDYARIFLDTWKGAKLVCVDPWSIPEGYEAQAKILEEVWGSKTRGEDYQSAVEKLKIHGLGTPEGRVVLFQGLSLDAVIEFEDESVDFVYVDGDHRYLEVHTDLRNWWYRLRKGGVLAGHDFICPGEVDGGWGRGIQAAVFEFANDVVGTDVYLINEEGGLPWSYYMIKP